MENICYKHYVFIFKGYRRSEVAAKMIADSYKTCLLPCPLFNRMADSKRPTDLTVVYTD